eukprot:gnl/TRDRNA2_/TRDRNA2_180727_c0_seq1.p1 gnl/TRDRNA2_/TRDRNA2_180727_c0~~gnl/TRDRNA2_/TRDRNA2_180727_c0_seq1.p1  ORF type:complete len:267 (-),score=58.60 gnl/TRDRNA2_/TRDRNA2_180727_c0_seq1:65-865(-)
MALHEDDSAEKLEGPSGTMTAVRSFESLSLGGVAAMTPVVSLPKKYRSAKGGERSTYQGAGIVPVCRLANGEVRILLYQLQKGRKAGVRWWDFGGKKLDTSEFTSNCACRKFAKQTYGIFGCEIDMVGIKEHEVGAHLEELYQGLSNLPLMLKASQEWAQLQLLDDNAKIFYNDQHEYHVYMLQVPYIPADILGKVSRIVDDGKRVFKWLSKDDFAEEVLASRLHTENFASAVANLPEDPWVRHGQAYGDKDMRKANGRFSATVVK